MIRTSISILAFVASTSVGFAECASPNATFLTCTFSEARQYVDVCVKGDDVTYTFGFVGAPPDLQLSVPVVGADFVPWPGVGSSIYESMYFTNVDITYEVRGGVSRVVTSEDGDTEAEMQLKKWGEINVFAHRDDPEQEKILATLLCDVGTSSYIYGGSIYDAKIAAGQCWDFYERSWGSCN